MDTNLETKDQGKGFKIKFVHSVNVAKTNMKKKNNTKKYDSFFMQLIWVTPAFVFLGIFVFFSAYIVFHDGFNGLSQTLNDFVFSTTNFKQVINDATFQIALRNSMLYVVITIPIAITISTLVAKALSTILKKRIFSFLQGVFFLPYVTSAMAVSMSFVYLFSSKGIVNQIIGIFGGDVIPWLNDKRYAIFVVLILGIWKSLPFQIIMLTSAFMRVNNQYYAAASIDGMRKSKQFFRVSLPQIIPMIVYLVTIGIIGSFKALPLGLFGSETDAEKVNAQTIVFWIYERITGASLGAVSYGKAGAASIILMSIILAVTIVTRIISRQLGKRYK